MNSVYYESIKKIIIENTMNDKKKEWKNERKKKNEYSTTKLHFWNILNEYLDGTFLIVKKVISMQKKGYAMNPKIGLIFFLFCLLGKMGLEFLKCTHGVNEKSSRFCVCQICSVISGSEKDKSSTKYNDHKVIYDYYKSRTMNLWVKPIGFLDWPWFWRAIIAHPPLSVFNKAPHWKPPSPTILTFPAPIYNSALTSERSLEASLHSHKMAPKQTWVSVMLHIITSWSNRTDSQP